MNTHRRLSRRAVLGAAGLTAGTVLTACSGDSSKQAPPPRSLGRGASPVANVPGYNDPTRWAGRVVKVGAFGGEIQTALREAIWRPFAAATGCQVQEFDTDYERLATSLQAGQPYADLLVADGIWAASAESSGSAQEIAVDGLQDRFAPVAPTAYAVPAYAYAFVTAFRLDAVRVPGEPESWQSWWDQSRYDAPRSLPAAAFGSLEAALLADGVDRHALYPIDLARAVDSLNRIGDSIGDRWWTRGQQPVQWLSSGTAELAGAWHYRVAAAQYDGRPVGFSWSQGLLVFDQWVLPRAAASVDVARDLIAYASSAEAQAALASLVPLGPVNPAALPLIDARTAARLPTAAANLDQLIVADAGWWAANHEVASRQFSDWLGARPAVPAE